MRKARKSHSPTPWIRVGPSPVHGLGAFAERGLPAGALLGVYTGRRYAPGQVAGPGWDRQLTYLFQLSNGEMIDGAEGGNATRHLNHSCEPNCEASEEHDRRGRPVPVFRTLRAVAAGEELFIDYSLGCDDGSLPSDYPCRCGAANCRGTLLAGPEDEAPGRIAA